MLSVLPLSSPLQKKSDNCRLNRLWEGTLGSVFLFVFGLLSMWQAVLLGGALGTFPSSFMCAL